MKKLLVLAVALMLPLTACGGDSGDEKKAKANLSKSVLDANDTDSPFDQKAANCFSDKVVDKLGVDKLKKYGILKDDLTVEDDINDVKMSSDDAGKAADAIADCVDFDKFLGTLTGGATADPKTVSCLKDAIDKDAFRDLMKAGFEGDEDAAQKIAEPLQKCALSALPSDLPSSSP